MPPTNGWGRYEERVLFELGQLREATAKLDAKIDRLRDEEIGRLKVEVAMLKVKSGAWGAAAGMIPALIVVIYFFFGG